MCGGCSPEYLAELINHAEGAHQEFEKLSPPADGEEKPRARMRVVAPRLFAVLGVMTQGGYQGAAERDELKSWVIAKLLWDPSRDEGELANDFILGHYGKAAPAVTAIAATPASMIDAAPSANI